LRFRASEQADRFSSLTGARRYLYSRILDF
jgi:hypothetical protein